MKLSPEILQKNGFKYHPAGISRADAWQGMAFWINDDWGITLRGRVTTANGGDLKLAGYFNSSINTVEDLKALLGLFRLDLVD